MVAELQKATDDVKMASHWLDDSVPLHTHLTFQLPNADVEEQLFAIQLVGIQEKIMLVPTFGSEDGKKKLWIVQRYGIHRLDLLPAQPAEFDAFKLSEPIKFEVLKFIADHLPDRQGIRLWDTRPSDLEGCITFCSPRKLTPQTALTNAKVPILTLLDALDHQDYIGIAKKVTHSIHSGMLFDSRNIASKRSYLQCVLAFKWLVSKGQTTFPSGLTSAFYQAILRKPGEVNISSSAAECLKIVKDADCVIQFALPAPSGPSKSSPNVAAPVADLLIDGDDGAPAPIPIKDFSDIDQVSDTSTSSSSSSTDPHFPEHPTRIRTWWFPVNFD